MWVRAYRWAARWGRPARRWRWAGRAGWRWEQSASLWSWRSRRPEESQRLEQASSCAAIITPTQEDRRVLETLRVYQPPPRCCPSLHSMLNFPTYARTIHAERPARRSDCRRERRRPHQSQGQTDALPALRSEERARLAVDEFGRRIGSRTHLLSPQP